MGWRMRRPPKALWALGSLAMLVVATSGEAETKPENDGWQFEVAPYIWIPEIDGRVTVRGRVHGPGQPEQTLTAGVSESGFVGASGRFEARRDHLTLFLNAAGTAVDTVGDLGQV